MECDTDSEGHEILRVRAHGSSFFTLGISIRYLISLVFFPSLVHFNLGILTPIPLFHIQEWPIPSAIITKYSCLFRLVRM